MIELASVVRLAPHARLRFDRHGKEHMLLYPERGLALSATAADVVALLETPCAVEVIVDRMTERYGEAARPAIAGDVLDLLRDLASRGLVVEVAS